MTHVRCIVSAIACAIGVVGITFAPAAANENAKLFGKRPDVLSIALSPSGEKLVWVAPGPAQSTRAFTVNVSSGQPVMFMELDGKPNRLDWCEFVSEDSVICSLSFQQKFDNTYRIVSRVISLDTNSKNLNVLSPPGYWRASGGWVLNWLKDEPNKVMFVDPYGIRKYDTKLGKFETDKANSGDDHEPDATTYVDTEDAVVRVMGVRRDRGATGYASDSERYYYRQSEDDDWKALSSYNSTTNEGFYPIEIDEKTNEAIGLEKHDGRETVFAVKLDETLKKRMVFQHSSVDVSGLVRLGEDNRVIGAKFSDDREKIQYFDKELDQLAKSLSKALPGLPNIDYIDASNDEKKLLMIASSDTDPGRYYLFDNEKKALQELLLLRPDLENFRTATVKPIRYKARDGTEIPGYLTLPAGSDGKNLPTIVMPHGGPQARDIWGFDWWAQFYAAEGYAVLQPNFRGSAGYGEDWFVENGFKSWETAVNDINDAGHWAIGQGIANPGKLAIVGWSYGGYAALQSGVHEPGLFKAIVAVAPVTDLNELKSDFRRYWSYVNNKEFIGSGPHIKSGSPSRHAERIQVPAMLFHGTSDLNVNVGHSKKMSNALKKAGKVSELVIYEEQDHHLPDSDVRTDMLTKSSAFLAQHLNK